MAAIDLAPYSHSPTHKAVVTKDYANLEKIIAGLPRLSDPSKIHTESASIAEEAIADAISTVIDRRDVPNRDTPLHLAVKLGDTAATETLMLAGADWSLQNEHGWSALQEAICNHQEHIAKIIMKHYQPTVWGKWCRRLPRLLQTMRRMRDFYMEISFEFESSVVPFISRIAPSDTYKIWKRGANLRADMTLAGFDGFKIQRADQTVLFLGDGDGDGSEKAPPGSLYMISHKHKEVMNALDGAGAAASDGEVEQEIQAMSQTMFRPGVDVTNAVLSPQMTWRRHEKSEVVGIWRAKVYDMQNVVVSIKSRKVQGSKSENEEINDILTDEEDKQLQSAINNGIIERREIPIENGVDYKHKYEKSKSKSKSIQRKGDEQPSTSQSPGRLKDGSHESEYKKGLRPILWLSPDFPLHTNELLPLLDILANKVKAIRRLRELLTTKLPAGTFPVKVAIPVVPTIRVLVTFTKFEELQPLDEFLTPPTSPIDADRNLPTPSSSSWFQWIKTPYQNASSSTSRSSPCTEHGNDPFVIPADYTWITAEEKKKKMTEKSKLKKGKTQNQ